MISRLQKARFVLQVTTTLRPKPTHINSFMPFTKGMLRYCYILFGRTVPTMYDHCSMVVVLHLGLGIIDPVRPRLLDPTQESLAFKMLRSLSSYAIRYSFKAVRDVWPAILKVDEQGELGPIKQRQYRSSQTYLPFPPPQAAKSSPISEPQRPPSCQPWPSHPALVM